VRLNLIRTNVRGAGAGLYLGPLKLPITVCGMTTVKDALVAESISGFQQHFDPGSEKYELRMEIFHPAGAEALFREI
jgi:hypothetical protein